MRNKYKRNSFYVLILFLFGAAVLFFGSKTSINSQITDIYVPEIPKEVFEQMNMQVFSHNPKKLNFVGFDWFTFYSPEVKTEVEVKLSGLSPSHFQTLGNQSIRYKFGNFNLKFKSLSSELSLNSDTQYALLQEMAAYNVAKNFYEYSPTARLVALNGDKNQTMVQWDDYFEDVIRENTFVSWPSLAKNSIYSNDKQDRYFEMEWDADNQTKKDLQEQFIKFLDPIYKAMSQDPKDFEPTNLNLDNYMTYLAIANIFGSGHMDAHNLFFIPDIKKGDYSWNMAPYDLAGLKYMSQPALSIAFNPIAKYVLRNPQHMNTYLKKVNF